MVVFEVEDPQMIAIAPQNVKMGFAPKLGLLGSVGTMLTLLFLYGAFFVANRRTPTIDQVFGSLLPVATTLSTRLVERSVLVATGKEQSDVSSTAREEHVVSGGRSGSAPRARQAGQVVQADDLLRDTRPEDGGPLRSSRSERAAALPLTSTQRDRPRSSCAIRFSLCVPAIKRDVQALEIVVATAVEQSLWPEHLLVVVSKVSPSECDSVRRRLRAVAAATASSQLRRTPEHSSFDLDPSHPCSVREADRRAAFRREENFSDPPFPISVFCEAKLHNQGWSRNRLAAEAVKAFRLSPRSTSSQLGKRVAHEDHKSDGPPSSPEGPHQHDDLVHLLSFLDADDGMFPSRLEILYRVFADHYAVTK